jgi:CDP-diacylglycerol--glycerol-3-phosphate 3-phosphatidyltransferase
VPLVFIIRGVIVDTIRSSQTHAQGVAPFALMSSPFGKFLVASKFMRGLYAAVKGCAFAGLALERPFPVVLPWLFDQIGWLTSALTYFFVYLAVLLCVIRGLPVIAEFVYARRGDILKASGTQQ